MSRGVQGNPEFVRRCIALYHRVQQRKISWVELEARLDEEFRDWRDRWPGRQVPSGGNDAQFISRNAIRRWAKNPRQVLGKRGCENLIYLSFGGCLLQWNQGRCVHYGGVKALVEWLSVGTSYSIPSFLCGAVGTCCGSEASKITSVAAANKPKSRSYAVPRSLLWVRILVTREFKVAARNGGEEPCRFFLNPNLA